MTTGPTVAVKVGGAFQDRGISALDCPVSGGPVGVRNKTLAIMAARYGPAKLPAPLLNPLKRIVIRDSKIEKIPCASATWRKGMWNRCQSVSAPWSCQKCCR